MSNKMPPAAHGSFSDSTTQTIADAAVAYAITFDTVEDMDGITLVDTSKMTVSSTGVYLIVFSAVAYVTTGANKHYYIWLRKNGADVARTCTTMEFSAAAEEHLMTVSYLDHATAATDYYELVWGSDSTAAQLLAIAAGASPTRPATPSIIATINKISK